VDNVTDGEEISSIEMESLIKKFECESWIDFFELFFSAGSSFNLLHVLLHSCTLYLTARALTMCSFIMHVLFLSVQEEMIEERDAREQRYRIELREKMRDAPFVEPQPFGDPGGAEKLSASRLRSCVVSVALLSGK
jgi:hypothetical protein